MNPIILCEICKEVESIYDRYNTELDKYMKICEKCYSLNEFKLISHANIKKKFEFDYSETKSLERFLYHKPFSYSRFHNIIKDDSLYHYSDVLKFSNDLQEIKNKTKLKLETKLKKLDIVIDPAKYTLELKRYLNASEGNLAKILKPYERIKEFTTKYGEHKYLSHENDFIIREWVNFGNHNFDVIEKYFDRKEKFILEVNSGKHKYDYNSIMNYDTNICPLQVFDYLLDDKPDLNTLLLLINNAELRGKNNNNFNNEDVNVINDKDLMDKKYLKIQENKKQIANYKDKLRGMNTRRNNALKKLANIDEAIKDIEKSMKDLGEIQIN